MQNEINIKNCLHTWNNYYTDDPSLEGEHLESEVLYKMAAQGGIANSEKYEADHLSMCPKCLNEWAAWRRAISAVEETNEKQEEYSDVMAYGLLKAAATEGINEPVTLTSECGRFTLSVFPQVDAPEKGIITLETSENGPYNYEDHFAIVRDLNGLVLLEGKIQNGRLARKFENLNRIDLSTWTVVVE